MIRKLMMLMAPEDVKTAPATTQTTQTTTEKPAETAQGTTETKPTVLTEKPAETIPVAEEFKVTYPEGFTLDEKRSKAFTDLAKKHGLKSEQAQDLVNFYVEGEKARDQQDLERITGWAEEAKADKEIGGANWGKTVTDAKRMLDKVGSPDLKKLLTTTGLGNHKEVIRLFAKLGTLVTEDRMPEEKPSETPVEKSLGEQMEEAFPASPGMFKK